MASAHHLIARQTIEIVAADRSTAEMLAARTSAIAGQLSALIEHRCDGLDIPEMHLRFDRIVLDLGRCDPARWEDALVEGVRTQLDEVLGAEVRGGSGASQNAGEAALALLAELGRSGRLPWWSEVSANPSLAVATLRREGCEPGAIAALLADATTVERLVNQLGEDDLVALLHLALPDFPPDANFLIMRSVTGQSPFDPASLGDAPSRAAMWRAILAEVAAQPALSASHPEALERLIAVVRTRLGNARVAATLVGRLKALDSITAGRDDRGLAEVLRRTWPALPADAAVRALDAAAEASSIDNPPPREDVWRILLTEAAAAVATPGPISQPAALDRLLAAVRFRLRAERDMVRPAAESNGTQPIPPQAAAGLARRPESMARGHDTDAARQTEATIRRAAARSEPGHGALAVPDAGLALLGPFLPAFFDNLGLTVERAFKNEAARHRAATLLHFLVTGEAMVPEFALALPKLLVGIELDAVHLPGDPLTDDEAEVAHTLLEAVIEHASILGQIGVHGLREAWLQRPGSLSTRDGSWLLRVERRTYDILIERLPWSFAWVRLPWMAAPLAVEW